MNKNVSVVQYFYEKLFKVRPAKTNWRSILLDASRRANEEQPTNAQRLVIRTAQARYGKSLCQRLQAERQAPRGTMQVWFDECADAPRRLFKTTGSNLALSALSFGLAFLPREVDGDRGDDGGDSGDAGAAGGDDPGSADGQPKPQGGSDPEGRPDWLPEKFWNPDLKQPRAEVMAKSFTELEGKFREKTDVLKQEVLAEIRAGAPENYEIKLSDDLKIPDNVELDLTENDPLVSWFSKFAKENGLPQETFSKALNEYVAIEIGNMPDMQAEIGKLGDHGQDRVLRVHSWLESKLSEDQMSSLSPLLSSATQVEALEKLMKSSGPADFEGDGGGTGLTLEELRSMQNDKRYWQEKDPAFIKKVEEGYKRLYKGQ